jgi:transcriptional regulator with XRE-family HTH domain
VKKVSKLKLALVSSGRHAYEIARDIGIGETRLSRIANGRITPTSEEAARIARVLGLDPTDVRGARRVA